VSVGTQTIAAVSKTYMLPIQLCAGYPLQRILARQILLTGFLCLFCLSVGAQSHYFPKGAFSSDTPEDRFVSNWYSKDLTALKEPSLFALRKTQSHDSYRFVWLRTFHHPVAIRVDLTADGTGTLTTKIASGAGGYQPGVLTVNKTRQLTSDEIHSILTQVAESNFWSLSTTWEEDRRGEDGSEWIFEGVRRNQYHVVTRWAPKEGPIHQIGLLFLLTLAQLDVPKKEFY
jgi:hypothetical protein